MNRGTLRIGIAGRRGTALAAGLRAQPDVEITAMCDIDEPRLAADADAHGIPQRFTRFSEMLDHVDAIVVATPMNLHASQSILALRAGKDVLSEVTACVSLDECWRLADAVRETGRTYMLSENYCYLRDNVLVRELVRQGLFGEPYYGEGEYLHDVKNLHHNPDGSPTWRYFWQVGQNGCTYPTHSLGPVMQWFTAADPAERIDYVVCVGSGRHTDPEHPHDDTSNLLVKMRSGKLVRVRLDMMSNRPHQMNFYSLQGTQGVYEGSRISGQPGSVWFGKSSGPGPVSQEDRSWRPLADFETHLPEEWRSPPPEALRAGHGGGDFFVARDFIEAVRGSCSPPIDIYAALEWTAAGLCSQISIAEGGAPVHVPDFRDLSQRPVTLDAPGVVV